MALELSFMTLKPDIHNELIISILQILPMKLTIKTVNTPGQPEANLRSQPSVKKVGKKGQNTFKMATFSQTAWLTDRLLLQAFTDLETLLSA